MFRENVGYYHNKVVRIDDTDFVMGTLWSWINTDDEYFVWKGMNDFRQIRFNGKLLQMEEFNLLIKAEGRSAAIRQGRGIGTSVGESAEQCP